MVSAAVVDWERPPLPESSLIFFQGPARLRRRRWVACRFMKSFARYAWADAVSILTGSMPWDASWSLPFGFPDPRGLDGSW